MKNFKKITVGFKKGQHKKIGRRETTIDPEFDKLREKGLRTRNLSMKIRSDMVELEKSLKGTVNVLNAITKDFKFDQTPGEEERTYFDIVEEVMSEIDDYNARFNAKLSKEKEAFEMFCKKFSGISKLIVQRDGLKIKFDKFISTVKRLKSQNVQDPLKMSRAKENLKDATKNYDESSLRAKTKFKEVLESIGETYDPFLVDLMKTMEELFENMTESFEKICDLTHELDI